METQQAVAAGKPWHADLTPTHWRVLTGSFLGWIFDGYEAEIMAAVREGKPELDAEARLMLGVWLEQGVWALHY